VPWPFSASTLQDFGSRCGRSDSSPCAGLPKSHKREILDLAAIAYRSSRELLPAAFGIGSKAACENVE
jgi:hypothetical protein